MEKLDKLLYNAKYTAGSYADLFMSIPIWGGEKTANLSERLLKEKCPQFLREDYTKQQSQIYNCRERMRQNLDTRPGMLYLQSNLVATIPFIAIGSATAEVAQSGIEKLVPDIPEIAKYFINSTTT
ncbi:MAG: hypothetical protein ABIB79_03235 [archaeon]